MAHRTATKNLITMKQPQKLLLDWIAEVCSSEEVKWLEEEEKKFRSQGNERDLVLAFSKVPRKITRKDLNIGPEETFKAQTLKKNWHPENLDSEQAALEEIGKGKEVHQIDQDKMKESILFLEKEDQKIRAS